MIRSDQREKLYASELLLRLCVSCEVARSSLDTEEDVGFYDVCHRLCSSVLVLAEDSWSAAASRLHLLCSITPADFLGPERNLTDSGEQHCQVHFNPSLHTRGGKKTPHKGPKEKTKQEIYLKLKCCLPLVSRPENSLNTQLNKR